jgi:hypothetical protein
MWGFVGIWVGMGAVSLVGWWLVRKELGSGKGP